MGICRVRGYLRINEYIIYIYTHTYIYINTANMGCMLCLYIYISIYMYCNRDTWLRSPPHVVWLGLGLGGNT